MHEIGRRWSQQGFEVGWVCGRYPGARRVEVIDGIRIHRVGGRFTQYAFAAIAYLVRLRGRYDVVVDCENGIPFFAPLYCRKPVVLVIHHVHQDVFRRELPPYLRWLAVLLEGWLMPRVYRRTRVVAVSASTQAGLTAMGFDASRIDIVSNGVDSVPPQALAQRRRRPAVLYLGRLKHYKQVDVLIRAMPAVLICFPNARLDIVGQGPDRSRLERICWSLGLASSVRFHGYLPAEDRDRIAAQAWVAVCPSAFEGWGIACLEAGMRGLPVIASNVAGLRDSVLDGVTGVLVPDGDSDALGRALIDVLGDPIGRDRMGSAGRAWAAEHSWQRSATDFADLLTELVSTHRARAKALVTNPIELEEVRLANGL
jgi:glycosyltransferase involved in cell wall biosynthesis